MCGRFQLSFMPDAEEEFERLFGISFPTFEDPPVIKQDVLPFRDITSMYRNPLGETVSRSMFWCLIPRQSPSFAPNYTWFNTRKEKLQQRFQESLLRYQRCVIPVNMFYENRKFDGKPVYQTRIVNGRKVREKERYAFSHNRQPIMALGGIYDIWGSEQYSCSIITLKPNSIIGEVHDRMPFIVPRDRVMMWLDTKIDDVDLLLDMIRPYPSTEMARKQVSGLEARK